MERFLEHVTDALADAALLETSIHGSVFNHRSGPDAEILEENCIEVAFAEAADYDEIHEAILREHQQERDIAPPDDCQYLCFV